MQEDNVSNAKSGFSLTGLSNLVIRAEFQQVLRCPSFPKVLDDLLLESEFISHTFGKGRVRSGRDSV